MQHTVNVKASTRNPKTTNELIQIIRLDKFTGQMRINLGWAEMLEQIV